MKRRDFVSIAALCGGGAPAAARSAFPAPAYPDSLDWTAPAAKPIDARIKVKPVCINLVHTCAYEGPCRVKGISPEDERRAVDAESAAFLAALKKKLTGDAVLLEPAFLYHDEDFVLGPQEWKKLQPDAADVDVYVTGSWPGRAPGIERFQKTFIAVGPGPNEFDIAAGLRSRGLEAHAAYDVDDLNGLLTLLRIRKSVQQTKLLLITDRLGLPPMCGISRVPLPEMRSRLGMDYRVVSYKECFDAMDKLAATPAARNEAEQIAGSLTRRALEVHIDKNNVVNDALFYLTARSLMNRYGCNGFTIDCIELCGSKIPNSRHFTPCLTHTLLKDQGIPSSCEGDVNALLAMMLAAYTCKKSVYMGNPRYFMEKGLLRISHDVPGLKMKGLAEPDLPFKLRNFTEGGWGTTFRYDFTRDKEEAVTIARFDPTASRLLLATATIQAGSGLDVIGCTLAVHLRVPKPRELYRAHAEFGNHLTMTYGDCTRAIKEAAGFLKVGVVQVG